MPDTTVLVLSGAGVPPYSIRGAQQTLRPIGSAARRTVNGTLVDLSEAQFRKYHSTITCTDQQAAALDGIWPGMTLTVDCIKELAYEDVSGAMADRPVVEGSERTEDGFVFYRPRLSMMVMDKQEARDEYRAEEGWTLELEEI